MSAKTVLASRFSEGKPKPQTVVVGVPLLMKMTWRVAAIDESAVTFWASAP